MQKTKGFTLIEVMIVVAVIAIIAAIAFPSYQDSVRKARRADAKASLLATAQILERCFTEFNVYNNLACTGAVSAGPTVNLTSDDGYYTIKSIPAGGAETLTASTYELTAMPTGKGGQDKDTKCTSFELLHTGNKESNKADDDTARCWE